MRPLLGLLVVCICTAGEVTDPAAIVARHWLELVSASKPVANGADGWFFLRGELRSYSRGEFWGPAAETAAAAAVDRDPLPAISDFAAQLGRAGIDLLVVPVPGKIAIYPDRLDAGLPTDALNGGAHERFITMLGAAKVDALDLATAFRAMRASGIDSHCHQDSHWSPAGAELAARLIADHLKTRSWYAATTPSQGFAVSTSSGHVHGDLVARQKELRAVTPKEALIMHQVTLDGAPVVSDRGSPVVLIGDSHLQVFSSGLLGSGGGLPDHLARMLGMRLDLVTEQGGGANGPRETLQRRGDRLAGKRCVVWLFTSRTLTESDAGWKRIAVLP